MSLQAKIEAVVYAADEPVSLAQLAAIFGREVEEELEAAASAAASPASSPDEAQEPAAVSAGESGANTESVTARATEPAEVDGREPLLADEEAGTSYGGIERDMYAAAAEPEQPNSAADLTDSAAELAEGAAPAQTATPEAPTEAETRRAQRQKERAIREALHSILDGIIADYAREDHGMEIREVAGGYRMSTKPEYHDAVRQFVRSLKPPMKLSLQALETLAVVAYKQPVTAPEISEIRGVESAGVLGSLLSRKLITTAGRKQVIGRPILYKTTKDFLLRFGLKDLNELPSMEEFEKMAGALSEMDAADGDAAPEPSGNGQNMHDHETTQHTLADLRTDDQLTSQQFTDEQQLSGREP